MKTINYNIILGKLIFWNIISSLILASNFNSGNKKFNREIKFSDCYTTFYIVIEPLQKLSKIVWFPLNHILKSAQGKVVQQLHQIRRTSIKINTQSRKSYSLLTCFHLSSFWQILRNDGVIKIWNKMNKII